MGDNSVRDVLWALAQGVREAIREDSGPREESLALPFVVEKLIKKAEETLTRKFLPAPAGESANVYADALQECGIRICTDDAPPTWTLDTEHDAIGFDSIAEIIEYLVKVRTPAPAGTAGVGEDTRLLDALENEKLLTGAFYPFDGVWRIEMHGDEYEGPTLRDAIRAALAASTRTTGGSC